MAISKKETLKYVIHETMGDDTVYIKVKFVYNTYMFGKICKSEEVIEPIIFQTEEEAANYAKYATGPCIEIKDTYQKREIYPCIDNAYNNFYLYDNVNIYQMQTAYNEPLQKMIEQYSEICKEEYCETLMDINNHLGGQYQIYFIQGNIQKNKYVSYSYEFAQNSNNDKPVYFSYMILKNKDKDVNRNRTIYEDIDYFPFKKNVSYIKLTNLSEEFDKLSKKVNSEIEKRLEINRKKQLSQTLISTTEKLINSEDVSADIVNIDISEYDQERNKIIEEELKRVSDYQNMLKKLIR